MENKIVVFLAGKGSSSNIVFHALNEKFNIQSVILEEKESKKVFLKRRIKKLGIIKVAGQVLFQFCIIPILNFVSKEEIARLLTLHSLQDKEIPTTKLLNVSSINQSSVAETLARIQPDVIVVNGTRIISKKILANIKCPIINTHAGITPMYRGVHGAYWALVNKDLEHCGVTVHLVDAGIDTGDIIYQSLITIDKSDTFVTYPVKQMAKGIPILIQAIDNALSGNLKTTRHSGKSGLWYHPTIWQYLYNLLVRKIK